MNTELLIRSKNEISDNSVPSISQDIKENYGTNIGHVDRLTIINNHTQPTSRTVDNTRCNIFVLKGKKFTTGDCFSLLNDRTPIKSTDVTGATSYPSLFVTKNDGYTKCGNASQCFHWGFVTKIEDEPHGIKIWYEIRSTQPLLQNDLNAAAKKLGISPVKGKDILDEVGWTIHSIDIVQALTNEGLNMTTY